MPIPKRRIKVADLQELRQACKLPHMRDWQGNECPRVTAPPSSWDSVISRDGITDNFEPMNADCRPTSPAMLASEDDTQHQRSYDAGVDNDSGSDCAKEPAELEAADRCFDDDMKPFALPPRRDQRPPVVRTRTGRASRAPARFRDFVCHAVLCPPVK